MEEDSAAEVEEVAVSEDLGEEVAEAAGLPEAGSAGWKGWIGYAFE